MMSTGGEGEVHIRLLSKFMTNDITLGMDVIRMMMIATAR